MTAVAEQGCAEMALALRAAHAQAGSPEEAMTLVTRAYWDFADASPALYDAMFSMTTDLAFGPGAPAALLAAWEEIERLFRPYVVEPDLGARTEVAWSAMHGVVTLARAGRLMPEHADRRLAILVADWLAGVRAIPAALRR